MSLPVLPACVPPHVVTSARVAVGDVVDITLKSTDARSYCTGQVTKVDPEAHCYEVSYRDSGGRHAARVSDWGWEDGCTYATFPDAQETTPEAHPLGTAIAQLETITTADAERLAPAIGFLHPQDSADGFLSGVRMVAQATRRAFAADQYRDDPAEWSLRRAQTAATRIAKGERACAERTRRGMDAASAAGATHAAAVLAELTCDTPTNP